MTGLVDERAVGVTFSEALSTASRRPTVEAAAADAALSRDLDWMTSRLLSNFSHSVILPRSLISFVFPIIKKICIFFSFILSSEGKLLIRRFQRKIYSEKQDIEESPLV